MLGTVLAGRYEVQAQLGIGGMGIVYRAYDTKLKRQVALKVIAPHLMQEENARTRFLQEAHALAALSHPSIVTIYDLAEDPQSGSVFIVMELLAGMSLRQCIHTNERPEFFTLATQLCRALEVAHARHILHRDLKPENVFICQDGSIKLMDFGLARLLDTSRISAANVVTGTVTYMAPEQVRGDEVDERTDLYALGVILYEYVCGEPPFHSPNPTTVLMKQLNEAPVPLRARVPKLSPEIDTLVLRLLAKDPAARIPSPQILRDLLARIRAGETHVVAPYSPPVASDLPPVAPVAAPLMVGAASIGGTPMVAKREAIPFKAPRARSEREKLAPSYLKSAPRRSTGKTFLMAFLAVLLLSALGVGAMLEWQTFQSKNQVAKQTTTPKKTNKRTAHTGRRRRSTAVSARENDDYTVRSGSYHETVSNSGSDTPKKGTGKPAPSHSPEKADGAGADGTTPDASDGAGTSSAVETTSDASIAPDTVERGGPATISATINTRGGSLSDVVVAVEVYNASGVKIGQQHWTGQSLSANQSRVYTWTWTAPENAGTYTVKIGVFGPDRTPEYHWNENAATITIQ